jgi:hypothetical protein
MDLYLSLSLATEGESRVSLLFLENRGLDPRLLLCTLIWSYCYKLRSKWFTRYQVNAEQGQKGETLDVEEKADSE